MSDNGEGFFAVDFRVWNKVCDLGVNASVAYLILARGTGGDNRTTSWSVNAIETYTGMSRPRARAAIAALVDAGLVQQVRDGRRPRYELLAAHEVKGITLPKAERQSPKPDWIWMPNSIVDGLSSETPPVEVLRQAQDQAAIRHFGNLYHMQDLSSDGGVQWRTDQGLRMTYEREEIYRHGPYTIWAFPRRECQRTWVGSEVWRAYFGVGKDKAGSSDAFWSGMNVLARSGLLEFVAHLVDADTADGEVLHPLPVWSGDSAGEALERDISRAVSRAVMAMVPTERVESWWAAVPVLSHMANVQLVGIPRLRYRPQTQVTTEWLARGAAACRKWAVAYDEMADKALGFTKGASDLQYKGEIKVGSR